jgi:hypothetical protein
MRIGCHRYDTTAALLDGAVPGFDHSIESAGSVLEIFQRLVRGEFDAGELGLTFYLRLREQDPDFPFTALPIFPARVFRHSCVFVNTRSGITGPGDLVGRTIGEFGTYGQDSGVWAKGALMDDHGFDPAANRWVIGGLDSPAAPFDFTPHPHPADVDVTPAPPGATLSAMLADGRIDALFSANAPGCVLDGAPHVRRLFPDHEAVERDYHRRTGIFPIMHAVVVRRDLLAARPGLAAELLAAFTEAKDTAAQRYRDQRRLYQMQTMVPWLNALVERNQAEFPADWWPYGVDANRATLDAFLRHHHEQGLSRRFTVEEVFEPV